MKKGKTKIKGKLTGVDKWEERQSIEVDGIGHTITSLVESACGMEFKCPGRSMEHPGKDIDIEIIVKATVR